MVHQGGVEAEGCLEEADRGVEVGKLTAKILYYY
jgi:hypothetical protein